MLTWLRSVLGRFLHTSPWPTLLHTDTGVVAGVKRRIVAASLSLTLGLGLVSVASIVTPLGVYGTEDSTENVHFSYIKDESAFGYGTPPRSGAYFTRDCDTDPVCPGNRINRACHKVGRGTKCTSEQDVRIPEEFVSLFRDGAASFSPSVSSIFDMEWRTYMNLADNPDKGIFLTPEFRQLSVLILDENIEPVEGLIVDMQTGGLGLRKLTLNTASNGPKIYSSFSPKQNVRMRISHWTSTSLWI